MWKHGQSGYKNHGCRCDVCTKAHSQRWMERYYENETLRKRHIERVMARKRVLRGSNI